MEGNRIRAGDVVIWALIGVLAFCAGFIIGEVHAIGTVVNLGSRFLNTQNITLDIDTNLLKSEIFRWKNNLG